MKQLELDKLEKLQSVADSGVDKLDDTTVKSLRNRNLALIIAVVAGVLFGGSCESKLSCAGREVVGCSCSDGPKKSKLEVPKKENLRTDY